MGWQGCRRCAVRVSDVARWVGVAPTWLGHRPEPVIHERLWACPLVLGDDARGPRWAGVDAGGRLIAMRDSVPGHEDYVERVHVERPKRKRTAATTSAASCFVRASE
jgi:hypothetical protein